jgi:hypothetical protein
VPETEGSERKNVDDVDAPGMDLTVAYCIATTVKATQFSKEQVEELWMDL